jgi:23S rRNA (uracil1939-C5)-methyltransferase
VSLRRTLDIEALAPGGEGIARGDGRSLFVPFTAPGDRVEVAMAAGGRAAHAELLRVLSAGPARIPPVCPHFAIPEALSPSPGPAAVPYDRSCGGCEWLHLAYQAQLAQKARALEETLRRIGRLDPGSYPLRPVLPSPQPLRYRSRAKFHLDRESGRLAFFRRRSHQAVRLRECHLLEDGLDALREAAGPALRDARLAPREVILLWSAHAGRGAAWLRLADLGPAVRQRAESLLRTVPVLQGLVLSAEGVPPVQMGEPVLLQERVPGDPAVGLSRSRPDVFQQANRAANAVLTRAALSLLAPDGEDALELFCGSGNFTVPLAARARSVAAVEVQGPALDLARLDVREAAGGPSAGEAAPSPRCQVRFYAGDALRMAQALAREQGHGSRRFGRALLDPPREGAKGIGPVLRDLGVPRAVYVSCDPATLARDLRECVAAGYRVAEVQPVDMFPQTHHVEAVALLVR